MFQFYYPCDYWWENMEIEHKLKKFGDNVVVDHNTGLVTSGTTNYVSRNVGSVEQPSPTGTINNSYSADYSVNITGNVGYGAKAAGATGGVNAGYTKSASIPYSIPDYKVTYNGNSDANTPSTKWKWETKSSDIRPKIYFRDPP
jgi:hypothetical protein